MSGGGIGKPGGNSFDLAQLDIDGSTLGDLYTKGASLWERLPVGSNGQILLVVAGVPTWTAAPGGGDMLIAVYDPGAISANAYDLDNFDAPGSVRGATYTKFAGGWGDLAPGTAGFVLTSGGGGADVAWATPAGDMLASVYDPSTVVGDAFDLANFGIAAQAVGDLYTRTVGTWKRLPAGTLRQVLQIDGTGVPAWDVAPLPINHIDGVALTRPTAATIQIGTGRIKADDDATDLVISAPLTVDLTASGAGGLDTGAEAADTWYDVYVIDGTIPAQAGMFVLQGNAPTLPLNYTVKRRVGVWRNDSSSDLLELLQTGLGRERAYLYTSAGSARQVLSAGAAITPTNVNCGSLVPPNTQFGIIGFRNASNSRFADIHQDAAGPVLFTLETNDAGIVDAFALNSSQQFAYSNSGTGGDTNAFIHGFRETL